MQYVSAVEFSALARSLTMGAKRAGLRSPGFRTPPVDRTRKRTVKRYADGTAMVAVVIHARPWLEVTEDMIEGIIVANGLSGNVAKAARRTLWRSVMNDDVRAA
jgi:hypothetical protein